MIKIKKYISCTTNYLLKLYVYMVAFVCVLVFVESCPSHPFSEYIGKEILFMSVLFFIMHKSI